MHNQPGTHTKKKNKIKSKIEYSGSNWSLENTSHRKLRSHEGLKVEAEAWPVAETPSSCCRRLKPLDGVKLWRDEVEVSSTQIFHFEKSMAFLFKKKKKSNGSVWIGLSFIFFFGDFGSGYLWSDWRMSKYIYIYIFWYNV